MIIEGVKGTFIAYKEEFRVGIWREGHFPRALQYMSD